MQYRPFGDTGVEVSALGFGTMRLPLTDDGKDGDVDVPQALKMIQTGFDAGVNYVDTAYPYHAGESEVVTGKALKNGYRDSVYVATKMPTWAVEKTEDFDKYLNEQLDRLTIDSIDFYLFHYLHSGIWNKMKGLGALEWAEKAKADGRIKHIGFSFHDTYDVFEGIIGDYDWEFCQIQYNYANEKFQAGTQGLKLAAGKGMGVVVMEPLLGGCLANLPDTMKRTIEASGVSRTPVDLALQWVWNQPEVATALSGMSTMEQVLQNIESAKASKVDSLTEVEKTCIGDLQAQYKKAYPIPCTACRYCMPCPHGVDIPYNFSLYNDTQAFTGNVVGLNRNVYRSLLQERRAGSCIACGECEPKCPQSIAISDWMPKIHEHLGPKE